MADYDPLVKKMKDLIMGGAARKLSYAGRAQLIKAVVEGILSF